MLIFLIFIINSFLLLFFNNIRKKIRPKQKILIIGGSSGLGLSLALKYYIKNKVVIISRTRPPICDVTPLSHHSIDFTKKIQKKNFQNYDRIFFCIGGALPNKLEKYKRKDIIDLFKKNLYSAMNFVLYYYKKKKNEKTTHLIFISSTASIFPFMGYAFYAPFKSALNCFLKAVEYEFRKKKIRITTVFANSMKTAAFYRENIMKPHLTKKIEDFGGEIFPDEAANIIARKIEWRNIFFDFGSNLLFISSNVESFYDLLLSIVFSPVVYCFKKYLHIKKYK